MVVVVCTDMYLSGIHCINNKAIYFSAYYYYYAAFNVPCGVIRMTNHRCRGHVDLRVVVSVIKCFEFLFQMICIC